MRSQWSFADWPVNAPQPGKTQPPQDCDRRLAPDEAERLFGAYQAELRCFLIGVLRDGQLASDVLQATFVKLLDQGGLVQARSRKAWLFRVAYCEALAVRRREGAGRRALEKAAARTGQCSGGATAADSSPAEQLLHREQVAEVRAALDQLPAAQLVVVRKRIFEDKTFAEIAAELNIPLGTAIARMHAALGKLRTALSTVGKPPGDKNDG